MNKIIAIGGGEIGWQGRPVETAEIDNEIIRLSGKRRPRLLFLPTAASDAESYCQAVQQHFGQRLGCVIDVLYLIRQNLSKQQITDKVLSSDIVYVGGGNTGKMMRVWKKSGADDVLRRAYEKGIVLSGLSAGAICWFESGNSDSRRFENPGADLIRVRGLGLVNALFCPHYDFEPGRKPDLKKMMKRVDGVAVAVDNCCAVEIVDDNYRVISSKPGANAYRVCWSRGEFFEEIIEKRQEFGPLSELLNKRHRLDSSLAPPTRNGH